MSAVFRRNDLYFGQCVRPGAWKVNYVPETELSRRMP